MSIPANAKKPSDRKAKAKDEPVLGTFTFEHDGETFESCSISEVLTPGFVRKNRYRSEEDLSFLLIETLFEGQPDALEAFDSLGWARFNEVSRELAAVTSAVMGVSLGE